MSKTIFSCILAGLILGAPIASGQTSADLFDDFQLHELRLTLNPADWEALKENFEDNTYYKADLVWRGTKASNIGIR